MNEKRIKISKRNFILAIILLILTNISLSTILLYEHKKTLKSQMEEHMLDIANTATYMLDSDFFKEITPDDKGSPEYEKSLTILRSFQQNIKLDYIYAVRSDGDGTFSFTIDPDTQEPTEFGQDIEATDALILASRGFPSVDKKPHSDSWGRFYSAYSPILDDDGHVAGIVGVDFNAEWYESKLSAHKKISLIVTLLSTAIAVGLSVGISHANRKRFYELNQEIDDLNKDFSKLDTLITKTSVKKLDMLPTNQSSLLKALAAGENIEDVPKDEFSELGSSIAQMQKKLKTYIIYVDSQTYLDPMTGVGNKAAYAKTINEVDRSIEKGKGKLSVAFFDLNDLNQINTLYGFETGDELLFTSAKILKEVFGSKNVYRVASDEFISILPEKNQYDMEEFFKDIEKEITSFNSHNKLKAKLSVAKGFSTFSPDKHKDFRETFIDAKKAMEEDKREYHAKHDNQF